MLFIFTLVIFNDLHFLSDGFQRFRDFILSASDLNKVALLLLVVQEKDCYAAVEVHAEESVLDLQHVFFY